MRADLKNKRKVLLIITGSIACYKSLDLIRLLRKKSYEVECVLTKGASEFISKLLVASLSGNIVYDQMFSADDEAKMNHIDLSRRNDLIVVAPASADFIAKIANGYADDLASSVILASNKKILIAPAMNEKMWMSDATGENLSKLADRGIERVDPISDMLACGESGVGKMVAPESILASIDNYFLVRDALLKKRVLITGGATYEPIDTVRFIGNYSSGKQAIEIAKKLSDAGSDVTFIASNISHNIPLPAQNIIRVKTTDEIMSAVKSHIKTCDIFIGCAAISDYKVLEPKNYKIKKTEVLQLEIKLVKNTDVLEYVGNSSDRPKIVVGFAAEDLDLIKNAKDKLIRKNCDLVVGNLIDSGNIFGSDKTDAIIVKKDEIIEVGKASKAELALKLVLEISKL